MLDEAQALLEKLRFHAQDWPPLAPVVAELEAALTANGTAEGHPSWCVHTWPHPEVGCSVIHRRVGCPCRDGYPT